MAHRKSCKALAKLAQLRPVLNQRAKSIFEGHRSAYRYMVRVALDAAQLGDSAEVEHAAELLMALGEPKACIGAAGDDLRLRMARARLQ